MVRGDCGADGFGRGGVIGWVGTVGALNEQHEFLGATTLHGEGRDGIRTYVARGLLHGAFDVLRVVVATSHHDEVLEAASDVELVIHDCRQVTGGQPVVVLRRVRHAGALFQALPQRVVEGRGGFLRAVQVTGRAVITVEPDFAHSAIRQLGLGLWVHDGQVLSHDALTTGGISHGVRGLLHDDRLAVGQTLAVEVGNNRALQCLRGGHNQRSLRHAIGGAQGIAAQAVLFLAESLPEGIHRRLGHRLRADHDAIDVAEVQLLSLGRGAIARGELEGEVRNHGIGTLQLLIDGLALELINPALGLLHEVTRRHDFQVEAQNCHEDRQNDAHIVVHRQPGHHARRQLDLHRGEDLQHVGHDVAVGQQHTRRGAGGAGGVLQEGRVVHRRGLQRGQGRLALLGLQRVHPALRQGIRQGVDGDDARALRRRAVREISSVSRS